MNKTDTKQEDKYDKLMKLEDEMLAITRKLKVIHELEKDLEHK